MIQRGAKDPSVYDIVEDISCDEAVDAARIVMGNIDLDPFSSEFANEFVQAKHFLTIKDDSINPSEPWEGNTYIFPHYMRYDYSIEEHKYIKSPRFNATSASSTLIAFKNLYKFWCQGSVTQGIFQVPSLRFLSTCQKVLDFPVCISRGRSFVYRKVDDEIMYFPTQPMLYVYLPPKKNIDKAIQKFIDVYTSFGRVIA